MISSNDDEPTPGATEAHSAEQKNKAKEALQPMLLFWKAWRIGKMYPDLDFKGAYQLGKTMQGATTSSDLNKRLGKENVELVCRCSDGKFLKSSNEYNKQTEITNVHATSIHGLEGKGVTKKMQQNSEPTSNHLHVNPELIHRGGSTSIDAEMIKKYSKEEIAEAYETKLKTTVDALKKKDIAFLEVFKEADELWSWLENKYMNQIKRYEETLTVLNQKLNNFEEENLRGFKMSKFNANDRENLSVHNEALKEVSVGLTASNIKKYEVHIQLDIGCLTKEMTDLMACVQDLKREIAGICVPRVSQTTNKTVFDTIPQNKEVVSEFVEPEWRSPKFTESTCSLISKFEEKKE